MIELNSLTDLIPVSNQIITLSEHIPVWCFKGELGAGKTTLIKAICDQLGVSDSMSSPTFSIVNEYKSKDGSYIYHFDFYRIKSVSEAHQIGTEEYFYSGNFCFIEWSEKIQEILPPTRMEIVIKLEEENRRKINLIEYGKK